MRRPWFKAQPVDAGFFATAPVRLSDTFEIARPASAVWDELLAENPLSWCRVIDRIEWTSARPFGVGTTRTATSLRGAMVIKERYFAWEEGRRQSFHAVEVSAPMFRRFAEDYLVEPRGESSCAFSWTVAFEPRPGMQLGNPVNRALLGTLFRDTRRHYGL
jgi:hypothetical protein